MLQKILLTSACIVSFLPAAGMAGRGSDGQLKIILTQAPSTMNPYLSTGTKDVLASSLVLEPLAGYDSSGMIYPRLAHIVPTLENGGLSADFRSITWRLKDNLKWSDGTPVTSGDVKFTAEYCMNPESGCSLAANFNGISSIETPDDLTVRINFDAPRPHPYVAFVGAAAPVLQAAQFAQCQGAAASGCTDQNFHPTGTGPFRVVEFRTNDTVIYEANPEYRHKGKPAFAKVTLKGGGDPAAAARSVLETGEFDYAWNLQLGPDVLQSMEHAGKGRLIAGFGSSVERIDLNLTDPSPKLPDGERSTIKHPHPILSDVRVRRALSMAIDRKVLSDIGFGSAGQPACNIVTAPEVFASDNDDCLIQDIAGAGALLEEAGWTDSDGDGIRDKDGVKLALLFHSSVNPVRQDFQTIIKQWWSEIGVETELKAVDPSVFFGGDPGASDTIQKFYADAALYYQGYIGIDPEHYLADRSCDRIPSPDTQWQGYNIIRFCDPEYDRLLAELAKTAGAESRGAIVKKMNDMLTKDQMVHLPLVDRGMVSAYANSLGGVDPNSWDIALWNVADWHRID